MNRLTLGALMGACCIGLALYLVGCSTTKPEPKPQPWYYREPPVSNK